MLPFASAATPAARAHSHGSPWVQNQHSRQAGAQFSTTWSPTAARVTCSPVSTTSPAASWPSTSGYGGASVPLTMDRSEWQTPAARIRDPYLVRADLGQTQFLDARAQTPASRTTSAEM